MYVETWMCFTTNMIDAIAFWRWEMNNITVEGKETPRSAWGKDAVCGFGPRPRPTVLMACCAVSSLGVNGVWRFRPTFL